VTFKLYYFEIFEMCDTLILNTCF